MVKVKEIKNKDATKPNRPKKKERSDEYKKYQSYIRSKDFRKIREAVRKRDKVCQCCGRGEKDIEGTKITLTTHHRTYEHLYENGDLETADCILLCSVCHRAIHTAKSNLGRFKR